MAKSRKKRTSNPRKGGKRVDPKVGRQPVALSKQTVNPGSNKRKRESSPSPPSPPSSLSSVPGHIKQEGNSEHVDNLDCSDDDVTKGATSAVDKAGKSSLAGQHKPDLNAQTSKSGSAIPMANDAPPEAPNVNLDKVDSQSRGLRQAVMQALTQEKEQALQDLAAVRKELELLSRRIKPKTNKAGKNKAQRNDNFGLDDFSNTVDSVSEAFVEYSGDPSLASINRKIDDLDDDHVSPRQNHDEDPINKLLSRPGLSESNKGLLVDAKIHIMLCNQLYNLFFNHEVLTINLGTGEGVLMGALFGNMCETVPWSVSGRWRALAADSATSTIRPNHIKDKSADLSQEIIEHITVVYGLPPSTYEDLLSQVEDHLLPIFTDALKLSLVIKRDILSVRMFVPCPYQNALDADMAESIWPEMGVESDDRVLGVYNLGLAKTTSEHDTIFLTRAKVVTEALLRYTKPRTGSN